MCGVLRGLPRREVGRLPDLEFGIRQCLIEALVFKFMTLNAFTVVGLAKQSH